MKKVLGALLIAMPFTAVITIYAIKEGPLVAALIFGSTAVIVILILAGVKLLSD